MSNHTTAESLLLKDDPYLLGYTFTDCPILTDLDASERGVMICGAPRRATPTWPRMLRNLDASAASKQAHVELLRQHSGLQDPFGARYPPSVDTSDC